MLGALRVVSVQRGVDPRELTLVPFGGAGPVHGAQLARLAGISTMLVPPLPGVLSALGFLLADIRQVFTRTRVALIGVLDLDHYNRELASLVAEAARWLEREAVPPEDRRIEIALDLRYHGQAYELTIPVGASLPLDVRTWRDAGERFHVEHKRRYGFDQRFAQVEVVTLRVTAIGVLPTPGFAFDDLAGPDATAALVDRRPVLFGDGVVEAAHFQRSALRPGNRINGPAIVLQDDCTTLIHPGQSLLVDQRHNLIVNVGGAR
jgi:N-methylhydantoinase A